MEFTFQDSGVYQVYTVEYTSDGYVRGTGPTQTYGTPPSEPDTTTTTTTTTN